MGRMRGQGFVLSVLGLFGTGVFFVSSGDTDAALEERLWRYRTLGKAFYENPTTQQQAVEQYRLAVQANPKSPVDRLNYGLALLRAGSGKEGMAELEAVQKADPSIPHTWFNLGIEWKKLGETERAIAQLERMAQLVPDEAITQYNLGALYKSAGRAADAEAKFALAANLDPHLAAPHFQLFNLYRSAGRADDAKRELALFQEMKKRMEEAGTGNEDIEWCMYSEVYETIDPKRSVDPDPPAALKLTPQDLPGKVDGATASLFTLDFDNDGVPDLGAVSSSGVTLWRRAQSASPQPALNAMKGALAAVPGDFNNDGFADLVVVLPSGPVLMENQKGVFRASAIKLPAGSFTSALWVDYDHDYDLDLVLLGSRIVLLRNQGQAGFADRTSDVPFVRDTAISGIVLRLVPDTKSHDILISYAGRPAVLYRDRLGGLFRALPGQPVPAGARGLVAADLNNDSAPDVVWQGGAALNQDAKLQAAERAMPAGAFVLADLENRGLLDHVAAAGVSRNRGGGMYAAPANPSLPANAFASADFDSDGRVDLATAGADGVVRRLANQTATKNGFVRVRLKGVKNLVLAPGSEVEVKSALFYQKRVYDGSPLHFGVRGNQQIDTVRITWPNGLIQNEIRQKPGATLSYEEAQRLSGSCPVIWTWNGREFEYITDVLGVAPLGASSGDGKYFPVDHDEYISIRGESLVERAGHYEVRITEELSEVSYLDQVQLIAVDHPARTEIFSNDKWKSPPFPEFRLFGVERRIAPVRARDDNGADVTAKVLKLDRSYADGFPRDMQGVANMHALELDFGAAARDGKAVLVLSGWVDWADGSTFLAQAQSTATGLVPPRLQMKDRQGRWVTVLDDMGMPAGKPKTIAVDLSGKWPSESREIRIETNLCVFWDEIFLSEEAAAEPKVRLTPVQARETDLRFRGFAQTVIHPQRRQPERFIYGIPAATSLWNPTPGMYTRYGEVNELTRDIDDRMVIMGSGDELMLRFPAADLPALPNGWRRDWLLKVDGWAKDRDANTAYSQTVEPLPFHGMSSYPYPASESYPETEAHREYRRKYNTRPALRLLRPLQMAGTSTLRNAN